jgi:hypothetical protein
MIIMRLISAPLSLPMGEGVNDYHAPDQCFPSPSGRGPGRGGLM